MKKLVLGITVLLLLSGCTTMFYTDQVPYSVNGKVFYAQGLSLQDKNGGSFNVVNVYDDQGKLHSNNAAMNSGILPALFHGAIAGAEMGAGIGAGLAVQGAASVTQVNKGGAATGGSATGGNAAAAATANPININTNIVDPGSGSCLGHR